MDLKDLVGIHSLTGVKRGRGLYFENLCGYKEETEFVAFRLDGVTYLAIEDPGDGYRSYCADLVVDNSMELTEIPSTDVICVMEPDGDYEKNDILLVLDERTLSCVLEVGTANTDDYYPYCVMSWHPENLYINRKRLGPTMENELKPCPFCSNVEPLVVLDDETETLFGVRCFKCDAAIRAVFKERAEAVEAWNRSVKMEQPTNRSQMDLISREWLLDVVENIIKWDTERDRNRAIHQVRELTPSVDAVEVKNGHYVGEYDGYADGNPVYDMWYCSECGCYFEDWDEMPTYKYCPECGARMDGEEEHNGE